MGRKIRYVIYNSAPLPQHLVRHISRGIVGLLTMDISIAPMVNKYADKSSLALLLELANR